MVEIQSTGHSALVAFCEHDCENSTTRSTSGTSNLLLSGHDNGVIQMCDLQTSGVLFKKGHGKGQESNASSVKNKNETIVTPYTPFYFVGQKYPVNFRVAETLSN